MRPATAGSLRPATAGSNRSAMEHRPLGRSPMPMRLQAAVQTNNIAAQIAALKGEIVMLQHRFQETRLEGESHHEMETLERKLTSLNPMFPDDGSTNFDIKCTLLEIMLEQIKAISAAALERSGSPPDPAPVSSRTHTFLKLVDFVATFADRKRVWDARIEAAEHAAAQSAAAEQAAADSASVDDHISAQTRKDITAFDLAMNEPTAAEVRKLVAEQKQLQEQIKTMLSKSAVDSRKDARRSISSSVPLHGFGATNGAPTAPSGVPAVNMLGVPPSAGGAHAGYANATPEPSARGVSSDQHTAAINALQAKVDALLAENAQYKKRMSQLEDSLKEASFSEKVEFDEVPVDVAKRVRGLAFGADLARMQELGIQVPVKPTITDESADKFAARVSAALAEVSLSYATLQQSQLSAAGPPAAAGKAAAGAGGADKNKKPAADAQANNSPGSSAMEGLLWATLHDQSKLLTEVLNKTKSLQAEFAATISSKDGEAARLQRVIATLEQRIQLLKVQSTKATLVMEAEVENIKKETEHFKKLYEDQISASNNTVKRIVNAKGQIATAEERERTLKEEIASRQQSIGDLTEQLKAFKLRIEEEQATTASVTRERQSLIQARDAEAVKVQRMMLEAKEREASLQSNKEMLLALKKEMREKGVAETEMQQKTWKLEVELHIAQNVISELRQREGELSKTAKDAEQCREDLQEEVYRLRDEIADIQATMQSKLEDAKQELQNAKAMLTEERQKFMSQEKEVERLRIVDLKMESLEQSFTNYAASKIAQREAGEEEERILGSCLEALDQDPFSIPKDKEGEAQLHLYIRELQTAKEQYEVDQRIRMRSSNGAKQAEDEQSNKKKLALLLQARLTDIQLFSCKHRLQQMALERQVRNQQIEIQQLKASQETLLQELSQGRLQCEALAHRNSELEIERKQFLKQRSMMETEVKNLKANSQRLRVSHDEQEKLLVDMGTKLQSARMHVDAVENRMTPLPQAVMGVE